MNDTRPLIDAVTELLAGDGPDARPSADDVCDVVWLAARLPGTALLARSRAEPAAAERTEQPPAPAREPGSTAESPPEDRVLPRDRSGAGTVHHAGVPLTLPAVRPLPESLALGRALRPLRIRRPSRTRHVVNERATAHQAARTAIWDPILEPVRERWPDAALVVDDAPSMAMWRADLRGLHSLFGQLGAFRSLRRWWLEPGAGDRPRVHTGRGPGTDAVAALRDPTGRRLVVVVTDGVDGAWGSGRYHDMLSRLSRTNPVLVVSVLPHWLWPPAGLQVFAGRVRVSAPLQPNAGWECRAVEPGAPAAGHPIPVLDLTPQRFGRGVGVLAGGGRWTRMRLLCRQSPRTGGRPGRAVPADRLAQHLASRMTPEAYRLLLALACMPHFLLTDAIRAVQQRLAPGSGVAELAEVLLCGVFRAPDRAFAGTDGLFRFRSAEEAEALAKAAGPVLEAATRRILSEHLDESRRSAVHAAVARLERPGGTLLPTVAGVEPTPVDGVGPPPGAATLLVRDVVCLVSAQSRAHARGELAARASDAGGLRLLDAADLRTDPDAGVARLRAGWTADGTTGVHLDHADVLAEVPALRAAVTDLIENCAGPRLVYLCRRPAPAAPARLLPLPGLGPRFPRAYQELVEETAPLRMFRLVLGDLGAAPVEFEDLLWQRLGDSPVVGGVKRDTFLRTGQAIADAIRLRRRQRVGWLASAPVDVVDLPDDIDAYLRRGL